MISFVRHIYISELWHPIIKHGGRLVAASAHFSLGMTDRLTINAVAIPICPPFAALNVGDFPILPCDCDSSNEGMGTGALLLIGGSNKNWMIETTRSNILSLPPASHVLAS